MALIRAEPQKGGDRKLEALLISECLLGVACRYDGRSVPLPAETLEKLMARYALVPVCPEQLGGLETPRNPSERLGDRVVMNSGVFALSCSSLMAAYSPSMARILSTVGLIFFSSRSE